MAAALLIGGGASEAVVLPSAAMGGGAAYAAGWHCQYHPFTRLQLKPVAQHQLDQGLSSPQGVERPPHMPQGSTVVVQLPAPSRAWVTGAGEKR